MLEISSNVFKGIIFSYVDPAAENLRSDKIGDLVAMITSKCHFAVNSAGSLHYYENGCFYEGAERLVAKAYGEILDGIGKSNEWKKKDRDALITKISDLAPKLQEWLYDDSINFKNCLYNWENNFVRYYHKDVVDSPPYLTTVQLPINYNPDAECPEWDKFVKRLFPEGAEEVAYKIIAYLMVPLEGIQKAIVLLGEAGNGKSTFLNMITEILGKNNISNLTLHQIEEKIFCRYQLMGKLANIEQEMRVNKFRTLDTFKAITGGDPIPIEKKFGDTFFYTPFVRLVFGANKMPSSEDGSTETLAYLRRLIQIPFTKTFYSSPAQIEDLRERLTNPQEMSGVVNKAISYLREIREYGLVLPPALEFANKEYIAVPEIVARWGIEHIQLTENEKDIVLDSEIKNLYMTTCGHIVDNNTLGKYINKLYLGGYVKRKRQTINKGNREWGRTGMKLINLEKVTYDASRREDEEITVGEKGYVN